jgi:hypothetical protein
MMSKSGGLTNIVLLKYGVRIFQSFEKEVVLRKRPKGASKDM